MRQVHRKYVSRMATAIGYVDMESRAWRQNNLTDDNKYSSHRRQDSIIPSKIAGEV